MRKRIDRRFFRYDPLLHELIGEPVEVIRSRDKHRIGLSGIIMYETKDAFLIYSKGRYIRIYKRGTEFDFKRLGLRVRGDKLYMDPAWRTKSLRLRRR